MNKEQLKQCSVTLSTWGTNYHGGNGMAHFIDSSFFGANVGHAAISMTIPATEETQALIQKYCLQGNKKLIPFERTTQNVVDKDDKVIKKDVYKIYF
ncbi:MAG: hypothetical protein AB7V32_06265, partial [Candidatus Berkiella sp.]